LRSTAKVAANMLSKVLKDAEVKLAPVAWRRHTVSSASGCGGAEAAELRARVADLEALVETKSRQSHAAGVRAGEESARQSLESGVREAVQQLAATIAELADTRADTIRRAEADTVRLSVEIARRVLHREISLDGSALEALIKAALEKLQAQEVHRVRVHPDQENLLRACLDEAGRGQSIAVVSDPVQPKGGAVFELSSGLLDASIDTQLAEIERGLTEQLEAHV